MPLNAPMAEPSPARQTFPTDGLLMKSLRRLNLGDPTGGLRSGWDLPRAENMAAEIHVANTDGETDVWSVVWDIWIQGYATNNQYSYAAAKVWRSTDDDWKEVWTLEDRKFDTYNIQASTRVTTHIGIRPNHTLTLIFGWKNEHARAFSR